MYPRIPERNKKPGVCYALTDDGVELPVIDVTHPVFKVDLSPEEWRGRLDLHIRTTKRHERLPLVARRFLLGFYQRHSVLLRGLKEANGTFLSGMNTYLMKLGSDNLGRGYTGRMDHKVADAFPCMAVRFRLQETARRIARGLVPALSARTGPLHLLNIAGGPGTDSLNALILLRKENPEWLARRRICIHILDVQKEAPSFGKRALAALREPGKPLHGLEIGLDHLTYDWADTTPLRDLLRRIEPDAVVAGSSEGGIFHYGSDDEIIANMEVLREGCPKDFVMTGSLTLEGPLERLSKNFSRLAVRTFSTDVFEELVLSAGWIAEYGNGESANQVVCLRKLPGSPSNK